jgi:polyhydroxyalkanoate synthesis regulator phasin
LLAGGAVLVLGGAAVGIVAAQSAPAGTPTTQQGQAGYQKFVDALAKRLGISSSDLEAKISQARTDAGFPAGQNFPGGPRRGPGGPGRPGFGFFGAELGAAATALNITPQQLMTEIQGKSLADVAQAHNVPLANVTNAMKDAAHKRIDAQVTAGHLTADQANQAKTRVDQMIDTMATRVMPQFPAGGPRGFGGPGFAGPRGDLSTAATFLGITPQQLMTELNGKSLADVAAAHGKSAADLANALKKAANDRIDAAVTAGKLTADQATQAKTKVDQAIDQQMNQVRQERTPAPATTPAG